MHAIINRLRILFKIYFKELLLILAIALISINIFSQGNNSAGIPVKGSVFFKNRPVANAAVLLQLSMDSLLVQGTLTDSSGSLVSITYGKENIIYQYRHL